MSDYIQPIIGLIGLIIVISVIIPLFSDMINAFTEDKCSPYVMQLQQKNNEIAYLKNQTSVINNDLKQCRNEYQILLNETITKQDIKIIIQEVNHTLTKINYLEQTIQTTNNNVVNIQKQTIYYFKISIIINFVFAFLILGDIFTYTAFGVDIKKNVIDWLREKLKESVHKNKRRK